LPLADLGEVSSTAIALQIENHPQARPARNLSRADMVVEATVEGDVTRFTAIFQCVPTEGLTGPIRSARYYSVDLWQDLGVLPVGFGASFEALDRYAQFGMPYVNGITGAWPWFRRYGTSPAPHNLYGDIEALRAAFGHNAALDRLAARVGPPRPQFAFGADPMPSSGRAVASLEIHTNSYWRFGWTYDPISGLWDRQDAGAPIVDAVTDEPLTARTVVVQRVTEDVVFGDPDPAGNPRRLHHLVGSGNGTIYVDGHAFDVRWSRPTTGDGTVWTYVASGARVVLPPGVIWWEIVPTAGSVAEDAAD
jgi:Protein of unknown function (DUF3048) N-terminal domain/Protein of unknown function (DUF3048) C-terminal domain